MVRTRTILLIAILLLVVGGSLVYANYQGVLSTVETGDEEPVDGDYIEVPTYGYLACEELDSNIDAPPSGFEKFGSRTISCQQQGSLVQDCEVTFKLPSEDEVSGVSSYLGVTKCTIGGTCETAEGDEFTDTYYAKTTFETNYNKEIDYQLSKNEYLYVEYQEGDGVTGFDVVDKGRFQITYRPFFVYRYDVFSVENGQRIENTEDCTNTGDISETNYIVESASGNGDLEEQFDELDYLDENNLRTANGRRLYFSGLIPKVPQYELFDDGMKYCYDSKIYEVEEVTVANGDTYKVANTDSNGVVENVDCCNDGDVPSGYTCENFEQVELSTSDQTSCSLLNPCPVQDYQPTAGGRFYTQECVDGVCETDYLEAECSFDEDCQGGYCDVDTENPENSECVTREPQDYCGNGVCEASFGENEESCPEDCLSPSKGVDPAIWIGLGMVAIAILLFIIRPDDKDKGASRIEL